MIHFVTTSAHDYTVASLAGRHSGPLPPVRAVSYAELLASTHIQAGTYVFCDMERLGDRDLVLGAELYRAIGRSDRCRVLNDPARVLVRYGLLRRLREAGINDFDAWPAEGCPRPRRFPVFLRHHAEHNAAATALLPDQPALDRALERLVENGESLRRLIVIEFCAEPFGPGVWRRYGMFRIGDRMHLDHVASENNWNVKYGQIGLVDDETYRDDELAVRENRYAAEVERAFVLAGIDYGRADFGVVGGRPQIYEINTNPFLGPFRPHPSPVRMATMEFAHRRFGEDLSALDLDGGGPPVPLDSPRLAAYRAKRPEATLHLDRLRDEIAALKSDKARLQGDVAEILASTSWRVTAPLRAMSRAVRRVLARR